MMTARDPDSGADEANNESTALAMRELLLAVNQKLSAQSIHLLSMSSAIKDLTQAVDKLCSLLAEDADPEELPQQTLDGEEGGRPRDQSQEL